jgi:hypothetical protein
MVVWVFAETDRTVTFKVLLWSVLSNLNLNLKRGIPFRWIQESSDTALLNVNDITLFFFWGHAISDSCEQGLHLPVLRTIGCLFLDWIEPGKLYILIVECEYANLRTRLDHSLTKNLIWSIVCSEILFTQENMNVLEECSLHRSTAAVFHGQMALIRQCRWLCHKANRVLPCSVQ